MPNITEANHFLGLPSANSEFFVEPSTPADILGWKAAYTQPPALKFKASDEDWSRFCREGLINFDDASQSNTRLPFGKMTKKYGPAYLLYLELAYLGKPDDMTDEEFCRINGGVPLKFLNEKIK